MKRFFVLLGVLSFVGLQTANALPTKAVVKPQKLGTYINAGSIVGGNAGRIMSILALQRQNLTGGAERFVITYGDQDGIPLRTQPGYFHVTLDQAGERLVLDLSQVLKTAVDQADLNRQFKNSGLIAKSDMSMDPQDGTTNITLLMKTAVEVKASIDPNEEKPNQIIIEMRPVAKR